ncbi:hypothetical protein IV203_033207 [Nitzschia inconspicua]|uniref:Uncharacterized protein n=1 Tax=Nitzschia inconspicua TaxID=303405 RepID=A0A9K3KLQ3_9STRA|nr:hypothetical protein IV203_033207 [Nitzschia inconspicua]
MLTSPWIPSGIRTWMLKGRRQCSRIGSPVTQNFRPSRVPLMAHPMRIPRARTGPKAFESWRIGWAPVEIGDEDLEQFELTYSTPEWEPGSFRYSSLEEQLLEGNSQRLTTGDMISNTTAETPKTSVRRLNVVKRCVISAFERDHSQSSAMLANISPILCGDLLAQAMNERYRVAAF